MSRAAKAALVAVAVSYAAVRSRPLHAADRRLGDLVRRGGGPRLDAVVSAGTDLGSVFALAGTAAVLTGTGRASAARRATAVGAASWVAAQAIKLVVGRSRPFQADEVFRLVAEPAGSSWPSGHPAVAAGAVAGLWPWLPRRARRVAAATVGFVAVSRVYVGVHYPSDVVAGTALGVLTEVAWRALTGRTAAGGGAPP